MRCLDPYSRRGVVLVAALVLLTFLAVVVTGQMERLQFVSNESRTAARIAQRELDVNSALVFAEGVLRADAAENDYDAFGDLWTRPCSLQVGETELLVRIGDHVFRGAVDDRWSRESRTGSACSTARTRTFTDSSLVRARTSTRPPCSFWDADSAGRRSIGSKASASKGGLRGRRTFVTHPAMMRRAWARP